jgi:hypothetical protein
LVLQPTRIQPSLFQLIAKFLRETNKTIEFEVSKSSHIVASRTSVVTRAVIFDPDLKFSHGMQFNQSIHIVFVVTPSVVVTVVRFTHLNLHLFHVFHRRLRHREFPFLSFRAGGVVEQRRVRLGAREADRILDTWRPN